MCKDRQLKSIINAALITTSHQPHTINHTIPAHTNIYYCMNACNYRQAFTTTNEKTINTLANRRYTVDAIKTQLFSLYLSDLVHISHFGPTEPRSMWICLSAIYARDVAPRDLWTQPIGEDKELSLHINGVYNTHMFGTVMWTLWRIQGRQQNIAQDARPGAECRHLKEKVMAAVVDALASVQQKT